MVIARTLCMLLAAASLGGCSLGPDFSAHLRKLAADTPYTLVYLTTGPAKPSAEESKAIFAGHMANIHRLAEEHKLLVAGPFDHPANTTWRGIFVFDVPTVAEANALVATDPGVKSGVFSYESHTITSTASLRDVPEFEHQLNASKGLPETQDPGANIRAYVMVTTEDWHSAWMALGSTPLNEKVISTFLLDGNHRGVIVLDASSADEVSTILSAAEPSPGAFVADKWWSSKSLERLGEPPPSKATTPAAKPTS